MWRVFCAVELPVAVCAQVLRQIAELKQAVPDARASWAHVTNLHLTIKFLGNILTNSVAKLSQAAAKAVTTIDPFSIQLETTGVFPERGPARVLWIGINDHASKLRELHQNLEDEAARLGFQKESRRFSPHLTIARLRNPQEARTLADVHKQMKFGPVEVEVSELLVIRSELSSAGSKYTVISRHQLGN